MTESGGIAGTGKLPSLATLKAASSPVSHMERPHYPDLNSSKLHPLSLNASV